MNAPAPEFDVAVSFLNQDEGLARQLAEALAPGRVFVYSKQQDNLAGNNGIEEFRQTFLNRSHLAVVLFRHGWGDTPFTNVESMAIQENALRTRWEHLLFVTQDDAPPPAWLPRHLIRFDLRQYPIAQLVGAIRQKLADIGVAVAAPSAADRAAQMAARDLFDQETDRLFTTAPNPFSEQRDALFVEMERQIAEIQDKSGWVIPNGRNQQYQSAFLDRVSVQLLSPAAIIINPAQAFIRVRHFYGRLLNPQEQGRLMLIDQPQEVTRKDMRLRRDPGMGWHWEYEGRHLSTHDMAAQVLMEFLEHRQRAMAR